MELRHMRYFVAVAEKLHFTRAAESLHLAQPSLTRQILNLEQEIGVRLLNRSKSKVELTEEGRAFLIDAKRVLALAAESVQSVQRLSRGETGQLNIAYLSHFNFDLLPKTLGTFRKAFPHIALNLFDMTPAEQFHALEARKIDLGFVGLRFSNAPKALQWECITSHKGVVVLPANHSLTRKRQVRLTDLKSMFFVGLAERTHPAFREWLTDTCQRVGFIPRILQDAEMEPGLLAFVSAGLGVTLAREQIKTSPQPGVAFRPIAPALKIDYWAAWNRGSNSKALQAFIQIVKSLV
jgi:DNA-binding transcriptional LysR family regulator